MVKNGFQRAEKESLYIIDGLNYVRTEPSPDGEYRYRGFIKTHFGEKEIAIREKPIFEGLLAGQEITKEEYDAYMFECEHWWRQAWLKNSNATRKITYCVYCGEKKD